MMLKLVQPSEAAVWKRMAPSLWSSASGEQVAGIAAFLAGEQKPASEVMLAFDAAGLPLCFVETKRILRFKRNLCTEFLRACAHVR